LTSDRFRDRGLVCGAIGVVVDVHGHDACDVEFSDAEGMTIAHFTVVREEFGDFELVDESDTMTST
jgi:hypothetical protein